MDRNDEWAAEQAVLISLAETLGLEGKAARIFATRGESERESRARWELDDPAILDGRAQVAEAARTGRRMAAIEAEAHARDVARHLLGISAAPIGQRVAEVAQTLRTYSQALKIQEAPAGRDLRDRAGL